MNNDSENQNLIIEKIPIINKYKTNYKFTLVLLLFFSLFIGSFVYKIITSKSEIANKILINRLSTLESELVKSENITDMKKAEIFILKKQLKAEQEKIDKNSLKKLSPYLADKEMTGHGIEIIIKEKPKEIDETNEDEEIDEQISNEQKIIHNEDLLRFVNFLWSLQASGISINETRLYTNSNIVCNGPVIRINENIITPPFIINVIGKNINKELVKKSPSVVSLELRGMEVSIQEKEVVLPKK